MKTDNNIVVSIVVGTAAILAEILFNKTLSSSVMGMILSIVLAGVIVCCVYFAVDEIYKSVTAVRKKEENRQREYHNQTYQLLLGKLEEQVKLEKAIYVNLRKLSQEAAVSSGTVAANEETIPGAAAVTAEQGSTVSSGEIAAVLKEIAAVAEAVAEEKEAVTKEIAAVAEAVTEERAAVVNEISGLAETIATGKETVGEEVAEAAEAFAGENGAGSTELSVLAEAVRDEKEAVDAKLTAVIEALAEGKEAIIKELSGMAGTIDGQRPTVETEVSAELLQAVVRKMLDELEAEGLERIGKSSENAAMKAARIIVRYNQKYIEEIKQTLQEQNTESAQQICDALQEIKEQVNSLQLQPVTSGAEGDPFDGEIVPKEPIVEEAIVIDEPEVVAEEVVREEPTEEEEAIVADEPEVVAEEVVREEPTEEEEAIVADEPEEIPLPEQGKASDSTGSQDSTSHIPDLFEPEPEGTENANKMMSPDEIAALIASMNN